MKVFIFAMLILVLLVVGTVIYINWLDDTIGGFEKALVSAADAASRSDWTSCQDQMTAFMQNWDKAYHHLEFFIHHKDIEDISRQLYELEGYAARKNKMEFLVKNGVVRQSLLLLSAAERITLENIL